MDTHAKRFGWRLWHLDDTGTRLLSPYHKGAQVKGGGRIVESACPHRQHALEIADSCHCGVYYDLSTTEAIERWHWAAEDFGAQRLALTFGAAVGDTAPDPILPDTAMRAPRYAILAIAIMPGSTTAGQLRERYGVNVTMKDLTDATFREMQAAVRADLGRRPATQLFTDLAAEPLLPDAGHVMDQLPHMFGWSVWCIDKYGGYLGTLSEPAITSRPITRHRTANGAAWFEAKCFHSDTDPACNCGICYTPSGFYCTHLLASWMSRCPSWTFAATFGIANGRITKDTEPTYDIRRCQRNFPMTICIPATHSHLRDTMQQRYGITVTPALHPETFRHVETAARTRLTHAHREDLQ